MRLKVYVDSSVIGAYFDERDDVFSLAQHHWSRIWWEQIRREYNVIVSEGVITELSEPDFPHSHDAVALVDEIPDVEIVQEVRDIVRIYIARKLMPADPLGDALHLALASYYACDYLLNGTANTWRTPINFSISAL